MKNNELKNLYFDILEVLAVGNFCPYRNFCIYEKVVETIVCVECISEYIIKSDKFSVARVNDILGD